MDSELSHVSNVEELETSLDKATSTSKRTLTIILKNESDTDLDHASFGWEYERSDGKVATGFKVLAGTTLIKSWDVDGCVEKIIVSFSHKGELKRGESERRKPNQCITKIAWRWGPKQKDFGLVEYEIDELPWEYEFAKILRL